jgi:hypothetical protein
MNRVLPRERVTFDGPNIVVCEGLGDVHFLKHLLDVRGIEPFEIGCPTQAQEGILADGKPGIVEYLRAIRVNRTRAANGLRSVAVMVDSDTDPHSRMQDAVNWLTNAGFVAPDKPFRWTIEGAEEHTAILLMPGMSGGVLREGTLEHLLWELVEEVAPNTYKCIEEFAACLANQTDWSDNKKAKMRVQAAIAGRCKTDPASSLAWVWSKDASIFPVDHAMFDFIANVFRDLPPPDETS